MGSLGSLKEAYDSGSLTDQPGSRWQSINSKYGTLWSCCMIDLLSDTSSYACSVMHPGRRLHRLKHALLTKALPRTLCRCVVTQVCIRSFQWTSSACILSIDLSFCSPSFAFPRRLSRVSSPSRLNSLLSHNPAFRE